MIHSRDSVVVGFQEEKSNDGGPKNKTGERAVKMWDLDNMETFNSCNKWLKGLQGILVFD